LATINEIVVRDEEEPPGLELRQRVFADGAAIVSRLTGRMNGQAKSLVGRFLKQAGGDCGTVLDALHDAEMQRPGDPVSWVFAAIKARSGTALGVHGQIARDWNLPQSFLAMKFDDDEPLPMLETRQ
jgi:hypothetical protein